jgi:hypothetical protein
VVVRIGPYRVRNRVADSAYYRRLYPYIPLGSANGVYRTRRRFGHLGAIAEQKEWEAKAEEPRRLRATVFGTEE